MRRMGDGKGGSRMGGGGGCVRRGGGVVSRGPTAVALCACRQQGADDPHAGLVRKQPERALH